MIQIVRISCDSGHVRIHRRTHRNTTLHHPSTHSDNDTDPKHIKSLHFRSHLDESRNCLFRVSAMSRCSSWSSLDLETLASGKSAGAITKDCRQQLLTPELWDEIRDGGKRADFLEKVSNRALASTCLIRKTLTSAIVATSLKDLDVICFSDEKIFRTDAVAPGCSFHRFSREKNRADVASGPLLFGIHHARIRGSIVTSGHLEPLFMTHPSEVGNPCTKKGASIMVAVGRCSGQNDVGHACSLARVFPKRPRFERFLARGR